MRFDEVCLECCPGILRLGLGLPGLAVFPEFPCFSNDAVGDADDFPLCDWLSIQGRIIHALVQPRVEALYGLVGILGFSELLVVLVHVCGQYPSVVPI